MLISELSRLGKRILVLWEGMELEFKTGYHSCVKPAVSSMVQAVQRILQGRAGWGGGRGGGYAVLYINRTMPGSSSFECAHVIAGALA